MKTSRQLVGGSGAAVRLVAGILFLLVALVAAPHRALAANPIVVGSGTPDSCTESALQNALTTASLVGGGDITFACGSEPVTIVLESTQPSELGPVHLVAPDRTTIDGGSLITLVVRTPADLVGSTFLLVEADVTFTLKNMTIETGVGVFNYGTFRASNVAFPAPGTWPLLPDSLAVWNYGVLTVHNDTFVNPLGIGYYLPRIVNEGYAAVDHAVFADNIADPSGAVFNSGTFVVKKSIFVRNLPLAWAVIDSSGVLTVDGCTFQENRGAVIISSGRTSIRNSDFIDNQDVAVTANSSAGVLEVRNCRFTGNHGRYNGGAIAIWSGSAVVDHSTFSGNSSPAQGGAIYNGGSLTLSDCVISANEAVQGGGIYSTDTASLTLVRTRVFGNTPDDIWPIQ